MRMDEALREGAIDLARRAAADILAVYDSAAFEADADVRHKDDRSPLTAAAAMRVVECREGVDQAWPGSGVVYFARLSAERTRSRMARFIGTPEYQRMTIRSWSTTTKLLELLDERAR